MAEDEKLELADEEKMSCMEIGRSLHFLMKIGCEAES